MIIFTPNTVIKSADINTNFDSLADGTGRDTGTRYMNLTPHETTTTGVSAEYPNSADSTVMYLFRIPQDYVSGNITFNQWIRGDTTGNVSMYRNTFRFRLNTAYVQIDSGVYTTLAMGTGSRLYSFDISSTNFTTGDILRVDAHRDGANVLDTASSGQDVDGAWISYTGII